SIAASLRGQDLPNASFRASPAKRSRPSLEEIGAQRLDHWSAACPLPQPAFTGSLVRGRAAATSSHRHPAGREFGHAGDWAGWSKIRSSQGRGEPPTNWVVWGSRSPGTAAQFPELAPLARRAK